VDDFTIRFVLHSLLLRLTRAASRYDRLASAYGTTRTCDGSTLISTSLRGVRDADSRSCPSMRSSSPSTRMRLLLTDPRYVVLTTRPRKQLARSGFADTTQCSGRIASAIDCPCTASRPARST